MTSHILLYHTACNIYQILHMKCNIYVYHDKTLKQISDENPLVPYHAKYANAVTGANFLKALNQRPEYVFTCCHCMLFHKTVQQFHITDYDMNNETVKTCLSHRYVMKLHRHTSHEKIIAQHTNGHSLYQRMSNMITYIS